MKYRKLPTEVDAFQYAANGWQSTSVQELARFIHGDDNPRAPAILTQGEVMKYVQPLALWNPPYDATLNLWVEKSQEWCQLEPGDWVIRELDGVGVYPCKRTIFAVTYEPVKETV